MKRLNLGAGYDVRAGWVNTDRVKLPGIDVVFDLDEEPWPWDNGTVDEIQAIDVFEHVKDSIAFMCQAGRILKEGGVLRIRSPHWKFEHAYTDPTHVRYCTERTWDYWIKGTEYNVKYGEAYCKWGVLYEKVKIELDATGNLNVALRRL